MKRIVLLSMCTVLCLQITACSALEQADSKTPAVEISYKLESGELAIDGKKYTFPSAISDWTNDGWHISNNYANTDTFEMEYLVESNEFEVFSDEKESEYVSMCAINFESEPAKIVESTTAYLSMKLIDGKKSMQVVLPGGITSKSTKEDVISAYGEPDEEDGEDLRYYYTNSDGLDIAVEISIVNEKVYMAAFALADSNWGSVTNAQECVEFINAALETSFYGKFDTYVEGKFDTEEGAQALYESEVEYYAQGLMYYLDIDSETVDGGIADGFRDVSRAVLAKFKWDDPVVDMADGATWGSFEITMYPTDFLDIIEEPVLAVMDSGLEGDEYAQGMLDAITPKVEEISYKEGVTESYDLDIEDGIISQETWDEIDDILMDLTE